ncbi:MAG: hypothetical protein WCD31_06180, partial [Gillisia sp.]
RYNSLAQIVAGLEVTKYDELVVVACGPTSNNIKLSQNSLYLATNRSIQLVDSYPFLYMVSDPFCLVDYLKNFKCPSNWKGTFFWYHSTAKKEKSI